MLFKIPKGDFSVALTVRLLLVYLFAQDIISHHTT